MFPGNIYSIRLAGVQDAAALERIANLDSQPPLTRPALVGDLDGAPAAGLSLSDGRVVADPFRRTDHLVAHLRLRAGVVAAFERTPSLRERLLAGLSPSVVAAARGA